jgi:hypothetical protein
MKTAVIAYKLNLYLKDGTFLCQILTQQNDLGVSTGAFSRKYKNIFSSYVIYMILY